MVSGEVLAPPTTSTRGMMCGGLNGWPITQRSGRLHADWITSMVMLEELDARIDSAGVAASISANNLALKSGRSGAFSCTRSASDRAAVILDVNDRRSRDAPAAKPARASGPHA